MVKTVKKQNYIYISAGVVFLLVVWWIFRGSRSESRSDILIQPTLGDFRVTVTATGELQAKNSVQIYGPMNARMAHIWQMKISKLVPEGTEVQKGDFVAELDRSEISNKIKDLETEIQKAESQYTQTRLDTTLTLSKARDDLINLRYAMEEMKLKKEQSAYEAPAVKRQAEIDYEKAVRAYEQAQINYRTKVEQAVAKMREVKAELTQYRRKLELHEEILKGFTVTAPADGMVIYDKEWNGRKKTEGSIIRGWDPVVATLPDLSVMESITFVNEVDIKKIEEGQQVEIGLDADPDKKLTGKVTQIANVGEQRPNSDSKVFEVKILVNESDSTLRPAMTTSNTIIVARADSVLHIPLEAIHSNDTLTYVYKKAGSDIVRQEIRLGLINEFEAVIEDGLQEADQLYLSVPEEREFKISRLPQHPSTASVGMKE